jgi:hypothetical protein
MQYAYFLTDSAYLLFLCLFSDFVCVCFNLDVYLLGYITTYAFFIFFLVELSIANFLDVASHSISWS